MRPIRSVSVLMPTWQGMEFLDRVLHALSTQRVDVSWDFRAIDSGSTDGTWELLGEWAERFPVPLHRERIHQVEFDHGDTRTLLAARSRGDLLVFLTQDAIPASDDWLATRAAVQQLSQSGLVSVCIPERYKGRLANNREASMPARASGRPPARD